MGGAPYNGPRLGGGAIFEVSVSRLYAKEHPGKLPTLSSLFDFSLIQVRLPIQSKGSRDISLCIIDCSRIKWAWLQSLAVYNRFMLKRGIKLQCS